MALPNDVNVRPIETPISIPVYTSIIVQYNDREAFDVTVGYYQVDPVESIEEITGGAGAFTECVIPAIPSDGCSIPTPAIGQGGFTQVTAFSVITFAYTDVSSFFWYTPEGVVIEEYDETGATEWEEQCSAAEGTVACSATASGATATAECYAEAGTAACRSSATRLNPDGSIPA